MSEGQLEEIRSALDEDLSMQTKLGSDLGKWPKVKGLTGLQPLLWSLVARF